MDLPLDSDRDDAQTAAADDDAPYRSPSGDLPRVVAIGASAGGLEALQEFFDHMPSDCGLAFVIVQHLSPDFKSLMDELLARHTEMAIHQIVDGTAIQPNAIYLVPVTNDVYIEDGVLRLAEQDHSRGFSLPIDVFLQSLAGQCGQQSVGVILSGTGSDGSRGIRAIHEQGGLVIVQDERTAKFDGMPKAAVDTGIVDVVLPPDKIPEAIMTYVGNPLPADTSGQQHSEQPVESGLEQIFRLLHREYGIDFSHYNPNTVTRRIERRLQLNQSLDFDDYVRRVTTDPNELNSLYTDLLIGVTRFFRDPPAFEALERVIDDLYERTPPEQELRVWVAGCASGEEAYSIAILLHERAEAQDRAVKAKVFATDVHRPTLEIATAGAYSESALAEVALRRIDRYFNRPNGHFQVAAELRRMVVFAPHNLLRDAPFTNLDLVTCRNLLMYFDPVGQKKALRLLHFGLKKGGVLFLGPSETPGDVSDEFTPIDKQWRLYRKEHDSRLFDDPRVPIVPNRSDVRPTGLPLSRAATAPLANRGLLRAYDTLLAEHVSTGLLINDHRELVHTFGGASNFFTPQDGRHSADVLDVVHEDLRIPIAGAIRRALKENAQVVYQAARVECDNQEQFLDVFAKPIPSGRDGETYLFISLRDVRQSERPHGEDAATQVKVDNGSNEDYATLESELQNTKENLQVSIEELETSNEELQATNEELVASNEELQSTNEELQSLNEELYTVNAEHQQKIAELVELTEDMDNLLHSCDIGTIFLDEDLCIRKFTPAIAQTFHLMRQDIGRRIDNFAHTIDYAGIVDDAQEVLDKHSKIEQQVRNHEGTWFLMRILPYKTKTTSRRVNGVVITFIDISDLKRAETAIEEHARKLEAANETLRESIAERGKAEAEAREAVKRRDQFLAMLSHELRNPLGAIVHASNLLDEEEVDRQSLDTARDVVRRQSEQMAQLLDDLLDVSRVTQGKIHLCTDVFDLASTVDDVVAEVRPMADTRDQQLHADVSEKPLWVRGDASRLKQIQVNLLNNASKYTPPGESIWLTVRREQDAAVIRVRDEGVGIPKEMLAVMFDLFVQSETTLDRADGGMGVGLTLVKSLVELHGGAVTAHSEGEGRGSEFIVRLPLVPEPEHPASEPAAIPARLNTDLKIVLVEDNSDARQMLETLLRLEGYDVYVAADGRSGLEAILSQRPEVALVDIGLPEMDGYEVARRVGQELPDGDVLLIALTGYGQAADRQKALDAGFNAHLTKPVDMKQLKTALQLDVRAVVK